MLLHITGLIAKLKLNNFYLKPLFLTIALLLLTASDSYEKSDKKLCKTWVEPVWKEYKLSYYTTGVFRSGNGLGIQISFFNPLNTTIKKLSWQDRGGNIHTVNVDIPPASSFKEGFDGRYPPDDDDDLTLFYQSKSKTICLDFYSEEEILDIEEKEAIFDNCVVSLMPNKLVDKDYKASALRKCRKISKAPTFWDKIRYGN